MCILSDRFAKIVESEKELAEMHMKLLIEISHKENNHNGKR
jgi:hypothetical protein